jgi:hypothetical protein
MHKIDMAMDVYALKLGLKADCFLVSLQVGLEANCFSVSEQIKSIWWVG